MLHIRNKNFQSILFQRNIFRFCYMLQKSQGVISYATLGIDYKFKKIIKPVMYTCILKLSCEIF